MPLSLNELIKILLHYIIIHSFRYGARRFLEQPNQNGYVSYLELNKKDTPSSDY